MEIQERGAGNNPGNQGEIRDVGFTESKKNVEETIRELENMCEGGNYIFRGTSRVFSTDYDGINSSLYRKYKKELKERSPIDLEKATIDQVPKYFSRVATDDIEILTDICHHGGRTTLIDFSRNLFVALFFACTGDDEHSGEVILLDINEISKYNEKKPSGQAIVLVEPSRTQMSHARVIAQHSVFIRALQGYIDIKQYERSIIKSRMIQKTIKKDILKHLEKVYNIGEDTIYNDLPGFIKYRQHRHENDWLQQRGQYSERTPETSDNELGAQANKHNERGINFAISGKHQSAIEEFNKAIKMGLDNADTFYNRGVANERSGNSQKAIVDYTKAIRMKSDYAEAYYSRGLSRKHLGQNQEAIADFTEAIRIKPDYADAYSNRGIIRNILGQNKEAAADFTKAIDINPNDVYAYMNRGTAYFAMQEYDKAIDDFTNAIKISPDYAEAYNDRGRAKVCQNNHQEAIDDFTEAIRINPVYAEAYSNRGFSRRVLRQYQGAIDDFTQVIEINPDDASAYINRGNTWLFLRDLDQVIADLDQAITLDSNNAPAYFNRGNVGFLRKDYDGAIVDFTKAIKIDRNDLYSYYYRGRTLSRQNKHQEAVADFTKAMELESIFAEKYAANMEKQGLLATYHATIECCNEAKTAAPELAEQADEIITFCRSRLKELQAQ